MSPRTSRDRLRAFMVQNPHATAPQAAKAVGVTRQRIHKIAQDEGIEFGDGTPPSGVARGGIGMEIAPPPLSAEATTGPAKDATPAAVLRVAADLVARGFDVFMPTSWTAACHLVAHDPGTNRFEGITVEISRDRKTISYDRAFGLGRRKAFAVGDDPIVYRPAL